MAQRSISPKPVALELDSYPGAVVWRIERDLYQAAYLGKDVGPLCKTSGEAECHAIAAWVAAHPETWAAPAEDASELDELTVYCEACGHEVDPALAVLDGEQMVCPGCAPCSVAQFEAMQQAEADQLAALVPDPATWVAVSEAPCEPAPVVIDEASISFACSRRTRPAVITTPAPIEPVTPVGETLARAPIFDALCQAVDELRDYWRDVPSRIKAINAAWEWVLEQDCYCFDPQGNLLVPSSSADGTVYAVGHTCPCDAGSWGGNCRHANIANIIGRARRIARMQKAA